MPSIRVEFPSYVNNLNCGLYVTGRRGRDMSEKERREQMSNLVHRASFIVKDVVDE